MAGDSNPFATRFTRPGAIPFEFPPGTSAAQLVDQLLHVQQPWGQIIGPHGSGKSTLLQSLLPELTRRGKHVWLGTLHAGEHQLPLPPSQSASWSPQTLVVVDGYEQLSCWSRWRLRRTCRRQGAGLLITAHRPMGLPTLFETRTSPTLASQIVARLLQDSPRQFPAGLVDELFARHQGNLREVLFSLYDHFVGHQSSSRGSSSPNDPTP